MRTFRLVVALSFLLPALLRASQGQEGAAFLSIPVGAAPAALGSAYSARANDAYAVTENPGALPYITTPEFTGQHLSFLESSRYEQAAFVYPLGSRGGIGAAIQYFSSGDLIQRNTSGDQTGEFSSYQAAYSLGYGHRLGERVGLGVTVKAIHAKISDVSANAFAADAGAYFNLTSHWKGALGLTNMGGRLRYLQAEDSLPMAGKAGLLYRPNARWSVSADARFPRRDTPQGSVGVEVKPVSAFALRVGYRTDNIEELSALAGLSTGFGVSLWGQELAYAWLPYEDLGDTHYVSLHVRFGESQNRALQSSAKQTTAALTLEEFPL